MINCFLLGWDFYWEAKKKGSYVLLMWCILTSLLYFVLFILWILFSFLFIFNMNFHLQQWSNNPGLGECDMNKVLWCKYRLAEPFNMLLSVVHRKECCQRHQLRSQEFFSLCQTCIITPLHDTSPWSHPHWRCHFWEEVRPPWHHCWRIFWQF